MVNNFYKKNLYFLNSIKKTKFLFFHFNPSVHLSIIVLFSILFFVISNSNIKKKTENKNNLEEITKTSEFSNLKKFFISQINSPYKEMDWPYLFCFY